MWEKQHTDHKKGFTLMETLGVVAIIVVALAIAIPSIIGIANSLKFKRMNEYAKTIFMAAQNNLIEMRSFGKLEPMDMVWKAVWCGVWEAVLIALACIGINITVAVFFDRSGRRKR